MLSCINKSSLEYLSLKEKAGVPENILDAKCRYYIDNYNRFPYLDEISGANSESSLRNRFKVRGNGVNINNVLETTGKQSIEEAIVDINNQYRDLETNLIPIEEDALVDIVHRPTDLAVDTEEVEVANNVNNFAVFNQALEKLANLYGIKFLTITDAEVENMGIPEATTVNAFIHEGNVYINVDRASVDAPLHEMMHLLLGSMRFENPQLYQLLIDSATLFKNYNVLASEYKNKTLNDVNEELFVSEMARYLTNRESEIPNLPKNVLYEINYNTRRLLDSMLMGLLSTKTISDGRLYRMSLKEIAKEVKSTVMANLFKGTFNAENSALHRKLNNIKSDLLSKKQLKEECD